MKRFACGFLSAAALVIALLWAASARALINPNYTVVELMQDSKLVLVARLSAFKDGKAEAEVLETLLGDAPKEKKLRFDLSEAEEEEEKKVTAAFDGADSAVAVLLLLKKKQDNDVVGMLEIGATWMGLVQSDGPASWKLVHDPKDLETTWGGSARRLVPAIRYTLSDRTAKFPVASIPQWDSDLALGKLSGQARGCLAVNLGPEHCVLVLSEGGDHAWRLGEKGAPPEDVTDKLGLTCKSKAMAAGDWNGDGRLDLASWDGARLRLFLRGADGKFAAASEGCELAECRSLCVIGGGLAAGGADGVTLLTPGEKGVLTARRLAAGPAAAELGPGGICAAADFNDDGAPDLMQVFSKGLVFYAGERRPGEFAAPVVARAQVVKKPAALVLGDYDADGRLDVLAAGEGGAALLSREEGGKWARITNQTGELGAASGFGEGELLLVDACPCDLNGDGRQGASWFSARGGPGFFFNRGFACFGQALTLMKTDEVKLPAIQALGTGQTAGVVCDLNGDLTPDLLAVDSEQKVWAVFCEEKPPRRFHLTLSAPVSARDPLTVSVTAGRDKQERLVGIWVVRPGERVGLGLPVGGVGPAAVKWKTPEGKEVRRELIVTGPKHLELKPE